MKLEKISRFEKEKRKGFAAEGKRCPNQTERMQRKMLLFAPANATTILKWIRTKRIQHSIISTSTSSSRNVENSRGIVAFALR